MLVVDLGELEFRAEKPHGKGAGRAQGSVLSAHTWRGCVSEAPLFSVPFKTSHRLTSIFSQASILSDPRET